METLKLRGFDLTKAQRGWVCDCCYTVETANQCSREEHVARGYSSSLSVIGMFLAMWDSWRNAKFNAARIQARPGEREANGWAANSDDRLAAWMPRVLAWVCLAAAVLCLIAAFTPPAHAGNCQPFFYKQAVVAVAPAYVAPVYYQAGIGIENDALAAKVAKIVVGQLRAELKAGSQQQTAPGASKSAIAQHCSKCHSGAAPKGGIVLDGVTDLACSQITASLRAIADESMPKDHKIAAEVKGQLMQELLALEAADRPHAVTVEKPEQTGTLD